VAEDCYVLAEGAVCDSFSAVDSCAAHHDAVLDLGVDDFDLIADACVGAYVGVWAHLAAVSENCVSNLLREGITGEEVRLVGDTMYESIIRHVKDIEVEKAARGYG